MVHCGLWIELDEGSGWYASLDMPFLQTRHGNRIRSGLPTPKRTNAQCTSLAWWHLTQTRESDSWSSLSLSSSPVDRGRLPPALGPRRMLLLLLLRPLVTPS